MELVKKEWTSKDNGAFEKYLRSIPVQNVQFTTKIVNSTKQVVGLKMSEMRKIASTICKGNFYSFLSKIHVDLYEFYTIKGLIIAKIKDCKMLKKHLESFANEIDSWSTCDVFCGDCKLIKKNQDLFFDDVVNFTKSHKEFVCRMGVVLLMKFYLDDEHIDFVLDLVTKVKNEEYYVKMGVAWLLAEAAIKYPEKVKTIITKRDFDKNVKIKAISKICDSFRIENDYKQSLKSYKSKFLH